MTNNSFKNQTKYLAIDTDGDRPRYLHLSGLYITTSKFWAWTGTIEQFHTITNLHGWDNLRPLSLDSLLK